MHANLNWENYFRIAAKDMSFDQKLDEYSKLALDYFEYDDFLEFCDRHLGHLDEAAYEFFGSDTVRDAIHKKVVALYPAHEIDDFTELFWNRIQHWRELDAEERA